MSRDPAQNHAARAETTARLLDAALELFAEQGFEAATMAELARRAGVSKGLCYHYFPTKEALLDGLVARHRAHVASFGGLLRDRAPRDALSAFAHGIAADVERDPRGYRLLLRALGASRPEVAPTPNHLVPIFTALGAPDPELEARFFQVALLGILTQCALSPRPTPVAPLVDRLICSLGGPP